MAPWGTDLHPTAQQAAFTRLQLLIDRMLNDLWSWWWFLCGLEVLPDCLVDAMPCQLLIDGLLRQLALRWAADLKAVENVAVRNLGRASRWVTLPSDISEWVNPY